MMEPPPAGPPDFLYPLLLTAALLGSAFFSAVEIALFSSRKSKLRPLALEKAGYKRALEALEHPGPLLFVLHGWISFFRIFAGIMGGFWAERRLGPGFPGPALLVSLAAALAVTAAALLLGELLPRLAALTGPERILAGTLPLVRVLGFVITPFTALSAVCSQLIRRRFRLEAPGPGVTEDELRQVLAEGEKSGVVESKERTMVEGVFYLGDRPAGAFMSHRSEIAWLDQEAGPEEARRAALDHGDQYYFPVAAETLDQVVGLVSAQDILAALLEEPWKGLKSLMRSPRFIPETMPALKAFEAFRREETDFLCVMDEYGGFAGTLSVKDLVQEIVGELSEDEEALRPLSDGGFSAGGGANIDDVAKALGFPELPEHPEYHTLAGFILELAGELPRPGAVFEWRGYRFFVAAMDGNRIDKVIIRPPKP